MRVSLALLVWVLVFAGHLRTSRKKGSHQEKAHGSWSPNNPFESKRANRRKANADKGRKIAAAKPSRPVITRPVVQFDDDDDPFAEDYGDNEPISKEDAEREKYEARLLRDLEKAERGRVYSAVIEAGGLQTRDDLREEYSEIPNTFKRRDGLPGDEMAEYLSMYYPEFGIEDERDLIDFLAA